MRYLYDGQKSGDSNTNTEDIERFRCILSEIDLIISDQQMQQFLLYYMMLTERNKVMNLTSITGFNDTSVKHFTDSLCLLKVIPDLSGQKMLDMGTGAGFPGIPLKIMFPALDITLMDSLNKRILFLTDVIRELELENVTAVHGRAEEMAKRKEYWQKYDLVVSRAVSNLSVLSEYCIPFVKVGGRFVSYKSSAIEDELETAKKAISVLGGQDAQVIKYVLPESEIGRSLVCIQKKRETPKMYPRKAGIPQKNPI